MKTVFVLIDHPNLDYMLVPVIEELLKSGRVKVVPCICNAGKSDLLESKKISYSTDINVFSQFLNSSGKKLFLNAADMNFPAHQLGKKLNKLCQENGIPTLTLEHASFALTDVWSKESVFNADRMAIFGTFEFDKYQSMGVSSERLVVTGCSKYDEYYYLDKKKAIRENRRLLNLRTKRDYILFAGQNHRFTGDCLTYSREQWTNVLRNIFEVLARNFKDLDIIIKPHPAEPFHDTIQLYESAIKSEFKSRVKIIDAHYSLPHAILGSEFLVSFSPSVMFESLLLKKPVIFFAGQRLGEAVLKCQKSGAFIIQSEWLKIPHALDEAMSCLLKEQWKTIRLSNGFIEKFVYKWDGKASNRISYLIEQMIEKQNLRLKNGIMVDWDEGFEIKRPLTEDIGFERYQRLMGIADEVIADKKSMYTLLDVGGHDGYFKNFVPNANYQSFDGIISSRKKTFLPYKDSSFDVVVAADVLEHVVPEDRKLFIYELIRVAKRKVIFSFPGELSAEYEALVLSILPHNKWLKEHQINGLPKTGDIEAILDDLEVSYRRKPNSSLPAWIYSVLTDHSGLDFRAKKKLNSFFQEKFYEVENREPAYRYIYTVDISSVPKRKNIIRKITNYLEDVKQVKSLQVSIIIPVFNKAEYTKQCLEALVENTPDELYEVIIVDNASTDGTKEFLRCLEGDVKIITNDENLGFAKACNQGAKAASGKYVVFLNNDTVPQPGWLEEMIKVAESDESVGIVGSKLLYPDGNIQHAGVVCSGRHPYHVYVSFPPDHPAVNKLREFPFVTGACILIKKDLFNQAGEFDERYLNGYEDIDLCLKVRDLKKKVMYCPTSVLYHDEGVSESRQIGNQQKAINDRKNFEILHQRWPSQLVRDDHLYYSTDGFDLSKLKFKTNAKGHSVIDLESYALQKKVSIIIPVFNQLEYTKQCLEALIKNTPDELYEVIIVDNASTDGTREFLACFEGDVKIITNEENLGFAKACNQGAKAASGKYVVFLNNDTVPQPGWLEEMIKVAESDDGVGIVGSKLLYPDGTIQHAGIEFINGIPDHPHRYSSSNIPEANKLRELDMVTGACLLIKRELFNQLDGFDESYKNGVEDIDLCLKVREKGFKVIYTPKSVLYHHEGKTPGRFADVAENLQLFFSRWGSKFNNKGKFINDDQKPRVIWEGSQFVYHSLALNNREISLGLINRGCEVSIIPYEPDQFDEKADSRFPLIAERLNKLLSKPADFHIYLRWPPSFTPPDEGHWIMIQPWEFGSLPKNWIYPMNNLVDEIWVTSNYVRECYIKSGVRPEKVITVPCGVDPKIFNFKATPMKLDTKKSFKFLFVGGTIGRKGIDVLLESYLKTFSSSDDVTLVIKDFGTNSFYKGQNFGNYIKKVKADPKNPEIVYMTKDIGLHEMAGLYTACDCLVHPYRGEGFGLPIAEAMACGLPVIVTKYGACLDFCDDKTAYFVSAKEVTHPEKRIGTLETVDYPWWAEPDKKDLAEKMRYVFKYRDEAKKVGRRASKKIHKEFNWEVVVNKVMERFKVIKERPIVREDFLQKPKKVEPYPVSNLKGFGFLAFPDWKNSEDKWSKALLEYIEAFNPKDDVSLILRVNPERGETAEVAQEKLISLIRCAGHDPENIPDIVIVDQLLADNERAGLYTAANVFVPTGELNEAQHLLEAKACGIEILEDVSAKHMHSVFSAKTSKKK